MSKLYMLVGVPGSGKSTWYENQLWMKDFAYISTDKHVENYAKSVNKTYNEVFKEYMPTAVNLMAQDVISARENNQNIVWDQTSVSIVSRKKKFRMLPDYYAIAVIFTTPNWEILRKRLSQRPGKDIPESVIRQMLAGWEDPSLDEGFKEIWRV